MATVLLIRDRRNLSSALDGASALLRFRRRHGLPDSDDEVLAICFRRELDAGLPWCPAMCRGGEAPEVGIRESVSLGGVWTLCWLDGPGLRGATGSPRLAVDVVGPFLGAAGGLQVEPFVWPPEGRERFPAFASAGRCGGGNENAPRENIAT